MPFTRLCTARLLVGHESSIDYLVVKSTIFTGLSAVCFLRWRRQQNVAYFVPIVVILVEIG